MGNLNGSQKRTSPRAGGDDSTPADERAERIVLGCVLGAHCYDEVSALLAAEDFYDARNRAIYDAMSKLAADNQPPADNVLLLNQLLAMQREDGEQMRCFAPDVEITFPEYARRLEREALQVFPVPFPREYAESIFEKAQLRRYLEVAEASEQEARGRGRVRSWEFLVGVEDRVAAIMDRQWGRNEQPLGDVFAAAAEGLIHGREPWVKFGFPRLDAALQPQKGDLVVVAADTGQGKTTFACNVALNVAEQEMKASGAMLEREPSPGERAARGVLYVSMEMDRERLASRMLYTLAEVTRYHAGHLNDERKRAVADARDYSRTLPWEIIFRPSITAEEVAALARRFKRRVREVALVVIDYLQLMGGARDARRDSNRQIEVAENAHALKRLAGELGCVVLCLSQFNREYGRQEKGRPKLWQLRDSGAIEQDADSVLFIYEPDDNKGGEMKKIAVAKNRDGEARLDIDVRHQAGLYRFEEAEQQAEGAAW